MINGKVDRKTIFAVLLGNAFEFYCFILFIVLAPYIAKSFFSHINQSLSYIFAYSISFCGYVSRPFGAIVLGGFSDKYSRKKALCVSVLVTGVTTFLIGIVPSYSSIGLISAIILVALRFIQGFLVSGEEGGAAVYLSEVIDKKRKCFIGALVLSSVFCGILLGRFVCNTIEWLVSEQFMINYGWRFPFIMALPIAMFVNTLRQNVPEIEWQSENSCNVAVIINPIKNLFSKYKLNIFKLIICCGAYSSLTCLMMVYLPNEQKGMIPSVIFTLGIGFMMLTLPILGVISDLFSARRILCCGLISSAILTIPCVALIESGTLLLKSLALIAMYINTSLLAAPIFSFLVDMFPRSSRCTGVSFVFNTSVSIFSGAFPLICSIIKGHYTSGLIPAYLVAALSGVSLIFLLYGGAVIGNNTASQTLEEAAI